MLQPNQIRPNNIRIAGLIVLLAGFAVMPAGYAQMPGGGMGGQLGPGGPIGSGPGLHRPEQNQDIAPPALPGASGVGNISAGPVTTSNENPTTLLFSAINHGDYTQARAAVSRGANLNARNALDETPIELAVELNRNNITFMLLSVRAEEGPAQAAGRTVQGTVTTATHIERGPLAKAPFVATQRPKSRSAPAIPDQPGVPNLSAGFLGFANHSGNMR